MITGWHRAGVALALGLGWLGNRGAAQAKPPDLPLPIEVQCPEARDGDAGSVHLEVNLDFLTGRLSLELGQTSAPPASYPSLDLTGPLLWHALQQHIQQFAQDAARPQDPQTFRNRAALERGQRAERVDRVERLERARRGETRVQIGRLPRDPQGWAETFFEIAEELRRQGKLEWARTCYQEAHLLSPGTTLGRRSMDRLHDLEAQLRQRGGEEEAEEPGAPADQAELRHFLEMLRRTVPLGTVPVNPND
jgi:hypothetical protein